MRQSCCLATHAWLRHIKEATPCSDCGRSFPYYVMHFDHRPDEVKLFNLSSARLHRRSDVEAEVAKCDVVCANCHHIRTWQRSERGPRPKIPRIRGCKKCSASFTGSYSIHARSERHIAALPSRQSKWTPRTCEQCGQLCRKWRRRFCSDRCADLSTRKGGLPRETLIPTCHPSRTYRARGMCDNCYSMWLRGNPGSTRPTCHPDRRHAARGLCHRCYGALTQRALRRGMQINDYLALDPDAALAS